ncbi:helix-turn-helix domain-containing protein [Rhodococcus qingshengii]|uniref:helix-turn-helix domain-containing protein n=1 Tax=Rhodococcus qingshengii TaxID=334542 RepID=UPI001C8BF58B|nr:helix-turn-helix domain-containing protein [Rhodococcus qingshengii]
MREDNKQAADARVMALTHPTVSVPTAAVLYGVSGAAMYRYVAEGTVPAIRVGRRRRVLSAPLCESLHLYDGGNAA